jgi:hypothetical protein
MAQMPVGNLKLVASESAYTEEDLKGQLKSCWDARRTKGNWTMLCNSNLQTTMDNWLCFGPVTASTMPIRRMEGKTSDNTFGCSIRSYTGSFGTVNMTPTHELPTDVYAELLDFDYLKLLYVDEVGWVEMENLGGGPRGYGDALFAVANLNPMAHGIIRKTPA